MKNSSQQEDSSRESPTLEDEETKKEEETAKQGFFVCFLLLCFIISSIFCPSTQLYNPEFLPHFFSWEPSCKRLYFKGKKKEEKGLLFGTLKMFRSLPQSLTPRRILAGVVTSPVLPHLGGRGRMCWGLGQPEPDQSTSRTLRRSLNLLMGCGKIYQRLGNYKHLYVYRVWGIQIRHLFTL